MTTENINKMKILFAQGEKEMESAMRTLTEGNEGKVRTLCRRAAGFYLQGLLEVFPKSNYGNSFMNNLRALENDSENSESVRFSAGKLIVHTNKLQINGKEAVEYASIIIDYCKEKTASFIK